MSGLQLGETLDGSRLKSIAERFGVCERRLREAVSVHSGAWCPSCNKIALVMASDRCCSSCGTPAAPLPSADDGQDQDRVEKQHGDEEMDTEHAVDSDRRTALVERACGEYGIGRASARRAVKLARQVPSTVDAATAAASAIYRLLLGGTEPMPARVVASWTGAKCSDAVLAASGVRRIAAIDVIDYAQLLARGIGVPSPLDGPTCRRLAAALAELNNTQDHIKSSLPGAAIAYLMATSQSPDVVEKAIRTQRVHMPLVTQAKRLVGCDQLNRILFKRAG